MKKLTILVIIGAIGTAIYKFFWITVVFIGILILIRIINKIRNTHHDNPSGGALWQRWDRE